MKTHLFASLALLPSMVLAAPTYLITDLGPASDGALQWADPIPCEPSSGVMACGGSRTMEVGAVKLTAPNIQHGAIVSFSPALDLGALPGSVYSTTSGANNLGMIVGMNGPVYPAATNSSFAVSWTLSPGGTVGAGPWLIHDLGNLMHSPYFSAGAYAVNDFNEIVGFSQVLSSDGTIIERAAIWVNGAIYKLQDQATNNLHPQNVALTSAVWINCQGNIAAIGFPYAMPNSVHFYLLTRQGVTRACPLN